MPAELAAALEAPARGGSRDALAAGCAAAHLCELSREALARFRAPAGGDGASECGFAALALSEHAGGDGAARGGVLAPRGSVTRAGPRLTLQSVQRTGPCRTRRSEQT